MNIHILNSGEKKRFIEELKERFGIEELNYMLIEAGKEKIRGFSGSLSREEILELNDMVRVELVGLYLARKEPFGVRLSVDALHLLKEQIVKNVIDINEGEFELWIRGHNLEVNFEEGVYAVRFGGDFVGSGYLKNGKLYNYIPRERQVRSRSLG